MKNTIRDILIFGCGFAAGAYLFHWKLKSQYESKYQQEAKELQEHFLKRYAEMDKIIEEKAQKKGVELATGLYKTESDPEDIRKPEQAIEIIQPEQFGDEDDYETSFLTYYADDELVFDGETTPVDKNDVSMLIGNEALKHFGEFMPGAIHVRNHNYHKDYEILVVRQNFHDLYPSQEDNE